MHVCWDSYTHTSLEIKGSIPFQAQQCDEVMSCNDVAVSACDNPYCGVEDMTGICNHADCGGYAFSVGTRK